MNVAGEVRDWVAKRLVDPGTCETRLLVLQGPPGCGKSTFIRTLASVSGMTCVEPVVRDLGALVNVLREGTWSLPLPLVCPTPVKPRLWLFTRVDLLLQSHPWNKGGTPGGDGVGDANEGESPGTVPGHAAMDALLAFLAHPRSKGLPPVVFTVHDFANSACGKLRVAKSTVKVLGAAAPTPAQACDALERVALAGSLTREGMNVTMRGFQGNMTQAMLQLEAEFRRRQGESGSVGHVPGTKRSGLAVTHHAVDTSTSRDLFPLCQLLLSTGKRLPSRNVLCESLVRVPRLLHVLWCQGLQGKLELSAGAVAQVAAAWDVYSRAVGAMGYRDADIRRAAEWYLVSAIRLSRHGTKDVFSHRQPDGPVFRKPHVPTQLA